MADIVPPPIHPSRGPVPDWAEIFWDRVEISDPHWLWTGPTNHGYGTSSHAYREWGTSRVHRVSYLWVYGSIPEGLVLDHLCRVRHCVRPDHLEPVTNTENVHRQFAVKTHCLNGHPLGEYVPGVIRPCAPCQQERGLAAHYATPTNSPSAARCGGCGELRHLRVNGLMHKHKVFSGGTCPGSGQPPTSERSAA